MIRTAKFLQKIQFEENPRGRGGGGVVNLTPSAFLGLKKVFKKQQMFFI